MAETRSPLVPHAAVREAACKRLIAGMFPHVCLQITLHAESFAAADEGTEEVCRARACFLPAGGFLADGGG